MTSRAKMVGLTAQSHRYLKECAKLDSIMTGSLETLQGCSSRAILLYFCQRVELMEARDIAHLVNAELVQAARRELESLPPGQLTAGKEEKARTTPQTVRLDITSSKPLF